MKNESNSLQILYQVISSAFCVIVVLANIISAKMVALPYFDFSIPAGLVIYPFTFLLSDLVAEIFGAKRARLMVYIAFGINLLSFGILELAIILPTNAPEVENAFQAILGLSGLRIFSSLIAYVIAQIADIQLYTWIKQWTGPRWLWLRNNGSTCIAQMIDTIAIDIIFLYGGLGMAMRDVFPIMVFSYAYKVFFSFACTPLFYLCVFIIRKRWQRVKDLVYASGLSLETRRN